MQEETDRDDRAVDGVPLKSVESAQSTRTCSVTASRNGFAGKRERANSRLRRSALASSFVAALELARLGKAELAQDETFGPLRLRRVPA